MSKSNIVLLTKENAQTGGVYNILPSFFTGLKKGLTKNNWDVCWIDNIGQSARLSLAFNIAANEYWKPILRTGCSHIMWTVDSCFYKNFSLINEYVDYSNFHIVNVAKTDIEPMSFFFPNFENHHYIPHGVDTDIWKYDNQDKDLDIVYLASIQEPSQIIKEVKQRLPENLFEIFMEMLETIKAEPYQNIWGLYKSIFGDNYLDNEDKEQHKFLFHYFFTNITYLVSYGKRIELVKSLEDIGVKVWGSPEWQKYMSGKNEYMGIANIEDAVKILPRSKVSLHLQPLQILDGLHERVLNSTMSESAVLCDKAPEMFNTFGDNFTYYDAKYFTDIKQKALSLLEDEDMRNQKVKQAKSMVLKDHTWEARAKAIRESLFVVQSEA